MHRNGCLQIGGPVAGGRGLWRCLCYSSAVRAITVTVMSPLGGSGSGATSPDERLHCYCAAFVLINTHKVCYRLFGPVDPGLSLRQCELTAGVIVRSVPGVLQRSERRYEFLHGWRESVPVLFEVSSGRGVVKAAPSPLPCVFQERACRYSDQTVGVAVCQGVEYGVVRCAHRPSEGIRGSGAVFGSGVLVSRRLVAIRSCHRITPDLRVKMPAPSVTNRCPRSSPGMRWWGSFRCRWHAGLSR